MISPKVNLEDYLNDRCQVTDDQAAVVRAAGNLAVRACPGSGKTRTVGTRLAYRIANWEKPHSGVAALSFTNVAMDEIAEQLERLGFPRTVSFPHFMGTINSFVDQFIFLPHGHLVMGEKCLSRRPELVLDHNRHWVSVRFPLGGELRDYSICDFHYDIDGCLVWTSAVGQYLPPPANPNDAAPVKTKMARAGFATHTDAMYWALRVLRTYPQIARGVATRFPEIMVDEFQDTSDVQLAILSELHKTGLCTLVLMGDPDQSIYEFHRARPEALISAMSRKDWKSFNLRHNFRSSQLICDVSSRFSSLTEPSKASGNCRDCPISPMVKVYADRDISSLPEAFEATVLAHGLDPSKSAILTLKNSNVDRLAGMKTGREFPRAIHRPTRRLIKAAHARDDGHIGDALEATGYCILDIVFGVSTYGPNRSSLGDISYRHWKRSCYELLCALPTTDLELAAWLCEAKSVITAFLQERGWPGDSSLGRRFPHLKSADAHKPASDFLVQQPKLFSASIKTIHGAKGETHDATMVVASPVLKGQGSSDARDWFDPLDACGLRPESVRRLYVAMTRARRLLLISIPQSAWPKCKPHFEGFQTI